MTNQKSTTMFERWADEGGVRIRFEMLQNGTMQIVIFNGDQVLSSAHLASFRVDHLKRWLNGEIVQPY